MTKSIGCVLQLRAQSYALPPVAARALHGSLLPRAHASHDPGPLPHAGNPLRSQVNIMGKLGVMHHKFAKMGGPDALVHSMFETVEGLGEDAAEAKKLAERIYIPALTGDDAALEGALRPLVAKVLEYEALVAAAAEGDGGEEAAAAAVKGGGKVEGATEAFNPELLLDDDALSGPQPPLWCVRDSRGIEPLALAAEHGHARACTLLLDARANVDARATSCGRSALHFAAEVRLHTVASL